MHTCTNAIFLTIWHCDDDDNDDNNNDDDDDDDDDDDTVYEPLNALKNCHSQVDTIMNGVQNIMVLHFFYEEAKIAWWHATIESEDMEGWKEGLQ